MSNLLPIDAHADRIAAHVREHRVTVIHGETGCGKSSRVPLILLEAEPEAKMFVSQPRRIAARALCDRVRDTCGPAHQPEDIALRLGHGVRDEAQDARIIFVTCGYLVRLVAHHPESLREHSHVIVDEVHERTVDADILCLLVRRLLDASPKLKVVLMSATLAGELYCRYFKCPPPIFVGAKRFPVDIFFSDDLADGTADRFLPERLAPRAGQCAQQITKLSSPNDEKDDFLLQPWERKRKEDLRRKALEKKDELKRSGSSATILQNISEDQPPQELGKSQHETCLHLVRSLARDPRKSCVLVFVAGMADIVDLTEKFESANLGGFSGPRRFDLVPVHSEIAHEEQLKAFDEAQEGCFKVVLATNSAESSVTLADCDDVIDLGTHKALRYDAASHRAVLAPAWVSQASATQRSGRTGRVRPGRCWRLYSRQRYELFRPYEQSEIHRQPLDAVVLNLRSMLDAPVGPMLAQTLEPPAADHVGRSLTALRAQGFLTEPRGDARAAAHYDWEDTNGDPAAARRAAEALEGLLTPQGRFVATLGVDLRLGRLVAVGAALGCGPVAASAAAVLSLPRSPLRIANPLVHQDPDEYNALVRDGLLARQRFDGGAYSEPLALARLDAAYAASMDRSSFCRAHCLAHGRAKQCAQACHHLRERVGQALGGDAARPVTQQELSCPLQTHALRCVLVWTMKEQLVKTKGVRAPGSAQKKKGGSIVQTPGARVELGGEGARNVRAADVCRLFPADSLFRYDEGVRKDLVAGGTEQAVPPQQVSSHLRDLGVRFELAATWCVFPSGRKGEGHITAWACRDVLDAPGAAELFDGAFGREYVDRQVNQFDSKQQADPFVLLEASSNKVRLQALKGLLDALPAVIACECSKTPRATATFPSAQGDVERALDECFFGGRFGGWRVQQTNSKPAFVFAPDGPAPTWNGEPAQEAPLLNDMPIGARLLSAMQQGYRDHQLRIWANPWFPGPNGGFTRRDKVSVKLDVPKPSYKLVFAPGTSQQAPPSAQVLMPFHSLCAVALHHGSTKDQVIYGVAGCMLDTAGGGARAEQLTLLPPGDEWLALCLRCATDPDSLPNSSYERQLQQGLSPDLMRKADAFRLAAADAMAGRRSPMRGSYGQEIDLVGALGAVFAKWLPPQSVNMNALQPLLDKFDSTSRAPEPPRRAPTSKFGATDCRVAPPKPPVNKSIDARAAIIRILEGAPGKALVLDKLRQAFKGEMGFDLHVNDLKKHAGYRGRGTLGQFLKTIPDVHRPDSNTVALKLRDRSSAFDEAPVEKKEMTLKPLVITDDWEDEGAGRVAPAPVAGASKRGGGGGGGGSGRRRGGGGGRRRGGGGGGGGGGNWRKSGGGGGGGDA